MPIVLSSVNGFWKKSSRSQAEHLCLAVLSQARVKIFYKKWGVPDTLEGRFDCATLHMILLLRHLKGALAQAAFDVFFSYTELTLREMGVSDIKVGRQVKKCAKFFYGALKAYNDALEDNVKLKEALTRNLFGGTPPPSLQDLIVYVQACESLLKKQDVEKITAIEWPKNDKKENMICWP